MSICLHTLSDPRSLPCIHSFCLICIENYLRDSQCSDKFPCPVCAEEFPIPDGGLRKLPRNLIISDPLDAKQAENTSQSTNMCEVCTATGKAEATKRQANVYCVECQEKLCHSCADVHRNSKMLRGHTLLGIDDCEKLKDRSLLASVCDKHDSQPLDVFCCTCRTSICNTCREMSHKQHCCSSDESIVDDLRQSLTIEVNCLGDAVGKLRKMIQCVERQKMDLAQHVSETEEKINKAADGLKQLIDRHKQSLLDELAVKGREFSAQLDRLNQDILRHISSAESLRKYSEELARTGTARDIARDTESLRCQAAELVKFEAIRRLRNKMDSIDVTFAESPSIFADESTNVVGKIDVFFVANESESDEPTLRHVIPRTSLGKIGYVVGITSIGNQLFVIRCDPQQQIEVYDTETFDLQQSIAIAGLYVVMEEIYGMTSCAVNSCIYISNFKHFTVHKIELANNNEMVNWSVAAEPTGLHVNGIQNLLVTCRGAMKLQEYTTGGQLVREINLNPDLPSPWLAVELTNGRYAISCGNRVCLVDASGQVVFNYGGTTGGSAIGQLNFPVGLAKVKNGCILVACRHSNRIVILNSTLSSARDLQLPAEAQLQRPWVLYLDESVDRMYVGEYEGGRVLVFDDLVNLGV